MTSTKPRFNCEHVQKEKNCMVQSMEQGLLLFDYHIIATSCAVLQTYCKLLKLQTTGF
jgi:hypothetical protein